MAKQATLSSQKNLATDGDQYSVRIFGMLLFVIVVAAISVEVMESTPPRAAIKGVAAAFTEEHARRAHDRAHVRVPARDRPQLLPDAAVRARPAGRRCGAAD